MLFCEGLVRVLFATDTFAMGVNAPARAVTFWCGPCMHTDCSSAAARRHCAAHGNRLPPHGVLEVGLLACKHARDSKRAGVHLASQRRLMLEERLPLGMLGTGPSQAQVPQQARLCGRHGARHGAPAQSAASGVCADGWAGRAPGAGQVRHGGRGARPFAFTTGHQRGWQSTRVNGLGCPSARRPAHWSCMMQATAWHHALLLPLHQEAASRVLCTSRDRLGECRCATETGSSPRRRS